VDADQLGVAHLVLAHDHAGRCGPGAPLAGVGHVDAIAAGGGDLVLLDEHVLVAGADEDRRGPPGDRLAALAHAGLRRLEQERDLNRLLVRDLARFPDLLAQMREDEIQRIYRAVSQWLATQAGPTAPERDWPALAAVLIGAVSHYWLLRDVFGQHPSGIDLDRYLAALVELAAELVDADTQARS
jgi:HTH-type transcriptional dual regulator CecR, C-terminal domain